MKKCLFSQLILLFVLLTSCTNDFDDNLHAGDPSKVIVKDSELYEQLVRVTTDTENPLEDIVCIDFVYPLQVKLYDSDLIMTNTVVLAGDYQFSEFLASIEANQSLSISYPISTTLENGELFTVNNNAELKLAIDNCSREDIISYCSSVFCNLSSGTLVECVWKVEYTPEKDNKYVGGTFLINPDNSLVFNFNGVDYPGNWIFLFVNDEFHLNINLEGTSEVATDWNIDRRVIIDGTIEIINSPKNIVLKQYCEDINEYLIGDEGPAGGIVFYDKGEYSNGWRYMEAAAEDSDAAEWGCSNTLIGSSGHEIGFGLYNSAAIVNFHDGLDNYYLNPNICNPLNNGTVAAQNALLLESDVYMDWFLPSEDELYLMYENLYLAGYGNFSAEQYWSATEIDAENAQTIDFSTGDPIQSSKIPLTPIKTRAVRYF